MQFEVNKNKYYTPGNFDFIIKYPYSSCSFFVNLEDLEKLREQINLVLEPKQQKVLNKLKTIKEPSSESDKYAFFLKEYSDTGITWEDFNENYLWCDNCKSYQEGRCICYAR